MVNWMLSIMVHKKLLTIDEAQRLAKKIPITTHPQDFMDAHKIMEKMLKEVEDLQL